MHYYQFNIKTYLASTIHLSNDEDLAYRRLIDFYYDTEQPIPTALPSLTRRLRVGLPELEVVLKEFFELREDGWHHVYCDAEIVAYHKFIYKQKANGSKGGRGLKANAKPNKPNAIPTLSQQTTINQQQTTIKNTAPKVATPSAFVLPSWIDKEDWDLWQKVRKGKKQTDEQKSLVVKKLENWKDSGIDFAEALKNAAEAGWQGLHEPQKKFQGVGGLNNKFDVVRVTVPSNGEAERTSAAQANVFAGASAPSAEIMAKLDFLKAKVFI